MPDQVERALAEDPLAHAPKRASDPISLGSLVVSLAALGWTIYRDLKSDREAAGAAQTASAEALAARLREDATGAVRLPERVSAKQQNLIVAVIAEEIVATEAPLHS